MTTRAASRPAPRSTHTHSQSVSHRPTHRKSSTSIPSRSPSVRVPASVGYSLPPNHILTDAHSPSLNYFDLIVDPTTDQSTRPKDNWSPLTSIQSFGPGSMKHIPLEAKPELEAFWRQSLEHQPFNLSHGNLAHFASTPSILPRPILEWRMTGSDTPSHESPLQQQRVRRDRTPDSIEVPNRRDKAVHRSSPDAKCDESLGEPSFFDMPCTKSPQDMKNTESKEDEKLQLKDKAEAAEENETNNNSNHYNNYKLTQKNAGQSYLDEKHPRLSLPINKFVSGSPQLIWPRRVQPRGDTLPLTLEDGPAMMAPTQLRDMVESLPQSSFLLLDLRVFPQYSKSRIKGALNLCIPTTLLKRPSFNLKKLQDTFTNDAEKARFAAWQTAKHIVVYDASSRERKDASSAINTLKKFIVEGWKGDPYILQGGYQEFAKLYPMYIDQRSNQEMLSSKINLSLGTVVPQVAPVAGGCEMPASKNAANPFFSNIRQNQDLIGGLGQLDIKIPDNIPSGLMETLPVWLAEAARNEDHGKKVSEKFLRIEQEELATMNKALSSGISCGTPDPRIVRLAGIEKGGKNRYNNIWPYEHTRVKLKGRLADGCDYINASHIKASRSNKRYIASQGPLPATFEDFWSVIWDQDVRLILMLTAESEGGQLKCHSYWSSQAYGPLKLQAFSEKKLSLDRRLRRFSAQRRDSGRPRANTSCEVPSISRESNLESASTSENPHVIVRKFTLSHAAHPFSPMREITQVQYSSWPDFGAPASPAQLLGLVELSNLIQNSAYAPTQCLRPDHPEGEEGHPMLVHCSAGCGRTGTFCTIDSVIDMLKRQRKAILSGARPMELLKPSSDFFGQAEENSSIDGRWVWDQKLDLVEKTVEEFRGQRLSMVQSLRQYVLCYETVLEWIFQQHTANVGERRTSSPVTVVSQAASLGSGKG